MKVFDISRNLETFNGQTRDIPIDAETMLTKLGFTIVDTYALGFSVELPNGWSVKEYEGQDHRDFCGPNGEKLYSYIKAASWDNESFLQASNISL